MRILITIFSFLFVTSSWSQQYFYKLYSGNNFDKGEDIIETIDSSYIVAGSSGSWGGNSQAFLMKIDTLGNYIWSHPYGGAESEEAVTVMEPIYILLSMRNLKPTTVAVFIYLQPFFATIFAIGLGKDNLNVVKIVSAILIFVGVYLVIHKKKETSND